MSDFIKAANPTAPITTEAEAEAAARSSAISIFIGVLFALFSVIYLVTNPQDLSAAMADQGLSGDEAEAAAAMGSQLALWSTAALGVIQLIFGLVQWKNPKKFIAILFIVLLVLGLVSTLATPLLAGSMPAGATVPLWLTVFTLVVYAIQLVLHFAGLRGMNKLDALQMNAAR